MVMAAPRPENLDRLARLLADGTLCAHVQATYELAQAPDALERRRPQRATRVAL
jgi:NADPH:quinone reductase-like Zn-dependent oxidoreductase